MLVHLYDCDNTGFPNLALLKLSAWHKNNGDDVIWNFPLISSEINYYGSVFTWSPKPPPGDYIGPENPLDDDVEHTCPDYADMDYSLGFLSRGCPNQCWYCVVPEKEGDIRAHSSPDEFIRHDRAVFMDNNWLASPRWEEDWEWLYTNGIKCDFNQGLDARLIDYQVAMRLRQLSWINMIRLSCDTQGMKPPVSRAIQSMRAVGIKRDISVNAIITKNINESMDRIDFLKSCGDRIYPFAQPLITKKDKPNQTQKQIARWVNHRAIFKSVEWEDYRKARC